MPPRPLVSGRIPIWGSAGNYPAGPKPWNGQPRIADPGAAYIQAGNIPDGSPFAEYENYWNNRQDQFLDYTDCIDALNYERSMSAFGFTYNQPSTFEQIVAFASGTSTFWLVGSSGITAGQVFFSSNGLDWRNDTSNLPVSPTPPLYTMVDVDPSSGAVLFGSNTSSAMTFRNASGVYSSLDLLSVTVFAGAARWIEKDASTAAFLVAGSIGATFPLIYKASLTGGGAGVSLTSLTVDNPSNAARGFFKWIATSSTLRIAIASLTAPGTQFTTWVNTDLAGHWTLPHGTATADPFASAPVALAVSSSGTFMVTCSAGQVYTTTDGATWTLASTQTDGFASNSLASNGSIWLATALTGGGQPYLKLSIDNGVTWNRVAWPFADTVTPMGIITADSRFLVSGASSGVYYSAQSIRTL